MWFKHFLFSGQVFFFFFFSFLDGRVGVVVSRWLCWCFCIYMTVIVYFYPAGCVGVFVSRWMCWCICIYITVMVYFYLDGCAGVFYFVCCAWSWKEEETDALQNLLLSTRLLCWRKKPSYGMELCDFLGWPLPIGRPWPWHHTFGRWTTSSGTD